MELDDFDRAEFIRHVSRTLYLCAWADLQDELGESLGGVEIDDVVPPTPSEALEDGEGLTLRAERKGLHQLVAA